MQSVLTRKDIARIDVNYVADGENSSGEIQLIENNGDWWTITIGNNGICTMVDCMD
jgi:hypothetical protein